MLSKELIEELKDAGFPVQTSVRVDASKRGYVELIAPTLAELIETCLETLQEVGAADGRFTLSWDSRPEGGDCWRAWYDVDGFPMGYEGFGDTPDVAVAHLWLVLYGKLKASKT